MYIYPLILFLTLLSTLHIDASSILSSNDRVYVVKSAATYQANFKKDNDFKQIFQNLTVQVKENTPIGTKLASIQADDHDTQNSKIIYGIVGGPDRQLFELHVDNTNINKVHLVNLVEFDFESPKKTYQILIRSLSTFLRYEVDVEIIVTDENDNKPQLEDFSIVFNNYKNHFPTGPIGNVPAIDLDLNDQLRYRVISGNNAQLVVINETNGDIQLSPWLNSNVPMKAIIMVEVSDGLNEAHAHMVLTVNLITETMLHNSVVLRLDGIGREEFLTKKYDLFLNSIARIVGTSSTYGPSNIVVFNVEQSLYEPSQYENSSPLYRGYHGNLTYSVNVSFSARGHGNDVEFYLTRQHIEERIYLSRVQLMQALDLHVAPIQDDMCVEEPCQNYQECQATYKFERAPKTFIATKNMIFRPIKATHSYACSCPSTITGMKHKSECNLEINPCFSNPCLNGGICHRHESGYTCECKPEFLGERCEHSFANSTCQSISANAPENELESMQRQSRTCSGKSRCVNLNRSNYFGIKPQNYQSSVTGLSPTTSSISTGGGFSCQGCPFPQWSTDLCQLKARSFNKNSYITLPSLRRRHRFHIMFQFATVQSDALLFYNGRYNDKHDFIALEVVDSHLKFSYSLGSGVTSLWLSSVSVSNGNWHKVAIDYKDGNVTLLIDGCDPVIDEALAKIQGPSLTRRCSNTSYSMDPASVGPLDYRMLDLSSPMQIGALPTLPTEFQVSSMNSFIGCISEFYIDHQLVDLYSPIQDVGTQIGCPEKRGFCQQQTCNGFPCQDAWGSSKCSCGDEYIGKSCEILISNEKVRKFSGNSYLTFNPIESTISQNWVVSMHFRTINPNGLLMKISIDPEVNIILEVFNGGLKLSYRNRNMTFSKINLDDGEWHFVELLWTPDETQLQLDFNPNLSVQSVEMGNIAGLVMRSITIGASITGTSISRIDSPVPSGSMNVIDPSATVDFTSSSASSGNDGEFNQNAYGLYPSGLSNSSLQSFVGCIYGVNVSDNAELWISNASEERNVERGCQVGDICESNSCPPNSRCVRRGMNQRKCVCNPGFVGDKCIPICELNPCQGENSKCIPITVESNQDVQAIDSSSIHVSATNAYQCECEPRRSGKNCEHQLTSRCPSNWWGRPIAGSNSSLCGPCNCDESKGFDGDCDKTTGQCFCKQNHYQPTGSDYCLACDCYSVGSLMTSCNQTTGQCKCRPGVVGRRCDNCASPYAEVTLRGCEVIYDACPKTYSDGIWWEKTPYGRIATQQCPPSTSTGSATRECDKSREWKRPNMFNCISNTFTDLYNHFQVFEENKFPMTSSLAIKIASNLRQALNETISNPSMQLYGSDMYISFRLIHHLIQHESKQTGLNLTHRQDRQYIRNIAESINSILDPDYADNWPEIAARSPNGGAEYLLKLLDTYGRVLIESQSDTFTQPFEVATKYFTIGMDTISANQLWDPSKGSGLVNGALISSSPPYATDPFGPPPPITISIEQPTGTMQVGAKEMQAHYNSDGSSIYLDFSSKDNNPSVMIPKYDNYPSDGTNQEDNTRVLIPLKTLKIKLPQESSITSPYYQAKSRAKREDLISQDFKYTRQQPAHVVYSIYRSLGPLLPSDYDNTVQHRLGLFAISNSPVVWLTVRPVNSSDFSSRNMQPKITYMLKMVEPVGRTRPQCAVWDFSPQALQQLSMNKTQSNPVYGIKQTGKFTTRGCEIKGVHPNHRLRYKYDYVNCSCDHLGAVTVLMDSANYDYLSGEETNVKDLWLLTALIISLCILTAIIFVLSCIRGHSIKSNSNSINKNLVFILVMIELLVVYSTISRSSLNQHEYQCKLVAIFLHYFSISLFFWLLVNAIHFYRMLTEMRDINHGPMKFYHILGYAVPAFFVCIAVGLRIEQFGNYLFCWLSIHEPIIWSMFGPISLVSLATGSLFLLALCKSLPVKEESSGAELVKNHMLINIIKTPLIGIYWLITVYAVNEALTDHHYIFPIIVIFKSVALFVLLCILDKHIRYNLYVSWLRFKGEKAAYLDESMNFHSVAGTQWVSGAGYMSGTFNKNYGSHVSPHPLNGQITTPGFQSSCTDIFRPDVLAFSAASTTSRSTATETSSSVYHHRNHRSKERSAGALEEDYGRSRSGRHRRRHKKSHRRHHHHKSHHHHHHRSHHHQEDEVDHYGQHYSGSSRRRHSRERGEYEPSRRHHHREQTDLVSETMSNSQNNNSSSNHDLASSHSSDVDDVSTTPKNPTNNYSPLINEQGSLEPDNQKDTKLDSQLTVAQNSDRTATEPIESSPAKPSTSSEAT